MRIEEIKPCPFCGGKGFVYANWSARFSQYYIFVKCDTCGGQGGITCDQDNPEEYQWRTSSVEKAINKWNTRHNKGVITE